MTTTEQPAFTSALIDRVYFVRWHQGISLDALQAVRTGVIAARQKLGTPLHYCSISAELAEPLKPEETERVRKGALEVLEHVDTMELVLERGGIKQTMLKTGFRAMVVAMRMGNRIYVHDTVEAMLERVKGNLTVSPAEVMTQLRAKGLLPPR